MTTLHQILECPLSSLIAGTTSFDLSLWATPCHFRFLDTDAFAHSRTLRMLETPSLPRERFAAISYPWKGIAPLAPLPQAGSGFVVVGAEDGGPVNVDVLVTACLAALQDECGLLWLDRLCILQRHRRDKNWQIERMHSVYSGCAVCLALIGGVQRLAGLEEETPWARRAWTLQEALVPPVTRCVFRWTKGTVTAMYNSRANITDVELGHSAMVELLALVSWILSYGQVVRYGLRGERGMLTDVVRSIRVEEATALKCAMDYVEERARGCAIWRCAIMRTSSRPVDMVFSIMGLFGVSLDPSQFGGEDRAKATLALAQGIMKNGGRADWLGLALRLGPAKFMSTMPAFPEVREDGDVVVTTSKGQENVTDFVDLYWYLEHAPTGSVDDKGYLHFAGKATQIREVFSTQSHARSFDLRHIVALPLKFSGHNQTDNDRKRAWEVVLQATAGATETTYAIVVGKQTPYNHAEHATILIADDVVVMIVEKIKDGRGFHRIAFSTVNAEMVQNWQQHEFSVGGPEELLEPLH